MKINLLIFLLLSSLFVSCLEKTKKEVSPQVVLVDQVLEIPEVLNDKSKLYYNNKTSLWTLNNELYSGYAVVYHRDSILKEKIGILEGKKQNESIRWFPDGHYMHFENYHKGKLQGEKKSWSSDSLHILISHLNYNLGRAHGVQKKWYTTGEIFKVLNLNMGKEEGMQQAFRKNGVLFANYETRNGKNYGLKKAALCFGVEDGEIVNKD